MHFINPELRIIPICFAVELAEFHNDFELQVLNSHHLPRGGRKPQTNLERRSSMWGRQLWRFIRIPDSFGYSSRGDRTLENVLEDVIKLVRNLKKLKQEP